MSINPPQCEHHRNIVCSLCKALASDTCLKDREAYFNLFEKMELKVVSGVPELHAKYIYKVDPKITFKGENSNFPSALRAAISTANRLIQLDPVNFTFLNQYQNEIDKAVAQGHLKKLSKKQKEELNTKPHNFSNHSVVFNEKSTTTSVRLVNNSTYYNVESPVLMSLKRI